MHTHHQISKVERNKHMAVIKLMDGTLFQAYQKHKLLAFSKIHLYSQCVLSRQEQRSGTLIAPGVSISTKADIPSNHKLSVRDSALTLSSKL